MPIAGVGIKFTTQNRNHKQDIPNYPLLPRIAEEMKRRRWEHIGELYTTEIRNHIETGQ